MKDCLPDEIAERAEYLDDIFDRVERERASWPSCPKHPVYKLEPASEAHPQGFCWACYREAHPEKKKRRSRHA